MEKTAGRPKINYQRRLDETLRELARAGRAPSLLLHSCCAPCSSAVLETLAGRFCITVFYYNPNITEPEEYRHRVEEQKRLLSEMTLARPVSFLEGPYDPEIFLDMARGLEQEPEGGARCRKCYALRLRAAALAAERGGFDYFCSTLSVSPYKNAGWINEIGEALAAETGVQLLYADFKKRGGYARSIELSARYGLYRQNYCGCVFSRIERERRLTSAEG